jgi:hypothetical protein
MASVLAFLGSIPEIIALLKAFVTYINKVSGNDPAGYIAKIGQAFAQLNAAQTQKDYSNAAKALADSIAGGPAK